MAVTRALSIAVLAWAGSFVCLAQTPIQTPTQTTPVEQSVHNLSVNGPGTQKSSTEAGVCIFCHAPHNTSTPTALWNKQLPADSYTLYANSPTYTQTNNPISQRSKLCLSCHDGTIALGQTAANTNLGIEKPITGASNLGTDLARDHPISFTMPAQDDGEIKSWLTQPDLKSPDPDVDLYDNRLECRTCHDPHTPDIDSVARKFLVRSNEGGGICLTCHDPGRGDLKNYQQSQHALAAQNAVTDRTNLKYASVAANGCMSCHTSHNTAGSGAQLLRDPEENTCARCHSSSPIVNPAPPDVMTELTTPGRYVHPVTTVAGAHQTGEAVPVAGTRHSECADCHNPHAAKNAASAGPSTAPAVQPSLIGARGMSDTGQVLQPATNEYEVCFRCHASSENKPQRDATFSTYGRNPVRQSEVSLSAADAHNTANQFRSQISSHNVTTQLGHSSPSLRTLGMLDVNGAQTSRPVTATMYIYCTDCHSSDTATSAGGSGGPSGPHSSKWTHLLERQYQQNMASASPGGATDQLAYTGGTPGPYAMCDKCHDVQGKLMNAAADTVFGYHKKHVEAGTSCSSCHAPHGVQGGDRSHHGGLIDLDTAVAAYDGGLDAGGNPVGIKIAPGYVPPAGVDPLINTDMKTCNLVCHGHRHVNSTYPPVAPVP